MGTKDYEASAKYAHPSSKMKRFKIDSRGGVLLKDALYNLHPKSGATVEYCIGLVVGVVSLGITLGLTHAQAIDMVAWAFPNEGRMIAPSSWIPLLQDKVTAYGKTWSPPLAG